MREYPHAVADVLRAIGLAIIPSGSAPPPPGEVLSKPDVSERVGHNPYGLILPDCRSYANSPGPDAWAYQDFWVGLVTNLRKRGLKYTPSTIDCAKYCEFGAGHRECLYVAAFTGRQQARVSFDIHRKDSKVLFDALSRSQINIEQKFGKPLIWDRIDGQFVSRIAAYYPQEITIRDTPAKLQSLMTWMSDHMLALQNALDPWLVQLDP
jgi:hypothetical protein